MNRRLWEVARLFLKLGTISFGGHAAHIAMMEHEIVRRREWLSHQHFLDLIAATNLIPGPNAVEMAEHVGYRRCGLPGSIVGGLCFSLPAVLITLACAWAYKQYGTMPAVEPFLYGIKPVVLALILAAVCRLGAKALRGWRLVLIGLAVAAAVLLGSDEVIALLVGSALGILLIASRRSDPATAVTLVGLAAAGSARKATAATAAVAGTAAGALPASAVLPWKLGLFFLKVGAVMFGGGYVLVAYIEGGLVGTYGLTQTELLDAVAIGQLTPGPLLTTATFVGYLLAGLPGAAAATVGILLPSFFFVAAVNPVIPRLRQSRVASLFLDAVGAASIGLIVAVAVSLGRSTLIDWQSLLIALVALVIALRWKVGPAWLVLGGALAGRLVC